MTYTLQIHKGRLSDYGWLVLLNFQEHDDFIVQFIERYRYQAEFIVKLMLSLGMKVIARDKLEKKTEKMVLIINQITITKLGIHK